MTLAETIRHRARDLRAKWLSLRAIGADVGASYELVRQVTLGMRPTRPYRAPNRKHTHCWQCGDELPGGYWFSHFCGPCNFSRSHYSGRAAAGTAVAFAIRAGELPHPRGMVCVDCKGVAVEYDHRDYSKPLDVPPVCRKCNARRGPGKWVHFKPLRELKREREAA